METPITSSPNFDVQSVAKFIFEYYGIQGEISLLSSERDQNFKISTDRQKFIFKISNPNDGLELLHLQNRMMIKLNEDVRKDITTSPILNKKNKYVSVISQNDKNYNCRLLTFIEGDLIADLEKLSHDQLMELGNLYAEIDKSLSNIKTSELEDPFVWDLQFATMAKIYLPLIKNYEDRILVEHFFNIYENNILSNSHKLRKSLIHNDGNDNNILVNKNGEISIIDFGDVRKTFLISELAIVCSYAIFYAENITETVRLIFQGYNSKIKLNEFEISSLFSLITIRLCTSVLMSAYQSNLRDDNYLSVSEGNAWMALRKLIDVDPLIFENELRKTAGFQEVNNGLSKTEIISRRKNIIGPSLSISYKENLKIVRGFGQYLYDEKGNKYLDAVNNVPHVGHANPEIASAVKNDFNTLYTNTRYLHDYIIEYSEKLISTFPDKLSVCYFVCSGSEANELAIRLARTHSKNNDLIVVDHAYHGNTSLLVDMSPYKHDAKGGSGTPNYVHKTISPDIFRGKYRGSDSKNGERYAEDVKNIILELEMRGKKPAAFIAESLPGCGGQLVLPENYLNNVYSHVRSAGGVVIADEVQVGFGRVGEKFWGFELQNVIPDIVTMGKPIGNGHPLAAVVTTREIADSFNNGMEYFNTFGGNQISCKIGATVLDIIQSENLQENAFDTGNYFFGLLKDLENDFPIIGDVRGKGLYLGVELIRDPDTLEPADYEASFVIEEMKNNGILISTDGPYHNVLKIKPPMLFNKSNVDLFVKNLKKIFLSIPK